MKRYDVIIVGGRVAGSTLAAHLGQAGVRVLLLERAEFPQEHPASSPLIQPVTMAMLDAIGADEGAYAHGNPKIRRIVLSDGDLELAMPIPDIEGRQYAYSVERGRFDHALWENALRYDTVDGLMGFSVTNLLWDDIGKTVIGVEGKAKGNRDKQHFTAKVVVGADGRFSTVARKVDAQQHDEHEDYPTSIYYAYWRGVQPYDADDSSVVAYAAPSNAYGFYAMPSADGMTVIGMEGRSDKIDPSGGEVEDFYLARLQENPQLWARLQNAERVTKIHGMRKIGNMFRDPGGLGWALTGDAYHQKDPIDGQGIYDAVFTSRALARALLSWMNGERKWDEALAWYDEIVRAEAEPQYEMTLFRVQQQMYPRMNVQIPRFLWERPVRWLTKDPQYMQVAGLALNRQIDPRQSSDTRFMMLAMLRGGLRELSEQLGEYETETA